MKDDCDINRIMLKYQKTGVLDHAKTYQGQYSDFSQVTGDYQEHMNAVIQANEMFMSLPSSVRKQFDNDPGEFLAFVDDPNNADEMVSLGLREAPSEPLEVFEDPTPPKEPKLSQKAASKGPASDPPKSDPD